MIDPSLLKILSESSEESSRVFLDAIQKNFIASSPYALEKYLKISSNNNPLSIDVEILHIDGMPKVNIDIADLAKLTSSSDQLFVRLGQALENFSSNDLNDFPRSKFYTNLQEITSSTFNSRLLTTKLEQTITNLLRESRLILISGPSSSGKTSAVIQSCKSALYSSKIKSAFCDLSLGMPPLSQVLSFSLLSDNSSSDERIIVFDNLQSQLSNIDSIYLSWMFLQPISRVKFVFITWPSARAELKAKFHEIDEISASGELVLSDINLALMDHIPQHHFKEILKQAAGDVFVGRILIEQYNKTSKVLSESGLIQFIGEEVGIADMSPQDISCLQDACMINVFDIPVKMAFLQTRHSESIEHLVENGVLRSEGIYLRAGHRSRAHLLLKYTQKSYQNSQSSLATDIDELTNFTMQYLRSLRKDELYSIVKLLDASIPPIHTSCKEKVTFTNLFRTLLFLISRLEESQRIDKSWGNNIASAVFASSAFAWSSPSSWSTTSEWIKRKVIITEDTLVFSDTPGNERNDFISIIDSMKQYDIVNSTCRSREWEKPAEIDLDFFYHNWLLGLLLSFEGNSIKPDFSYRRKLLKLIKSRQLPFGGFYPQRVPWVTARILMGAASCGENYQTNRWIKTAADWLLENNRSTPGLTQGFWASGSGTWNSSEQCTAMCALALRAVGIPHEYILEPLHLQCLKESISHFDIENDEIDILLILEVLAEFASFDNQCEHLFEDIISKYKAMQGKSLQSIDPTIYREESSKYPFVVSGIMNLLWERTSNSLHSFLISIAPSMASQPDDAIVDEQTKLNALKRIGLLLNELKDSNKSKRETIVKLKNSGTNQSVSSLQKTVDLIQSFIEKIETTQETISSKTTFNNFDLNALSDLYEDASKSLRGK